MTLDEQVAQIERMVLQIGWLGQRQFMQLLAEERFDLTVPQFHTLRHLAHCTAACTMSDLARATHQSAASLTGVVDRLLDKHLVERVRSADDRRQVHVAMSERGRVLLHTITAARHIDLHAALDKFDTPAKENLVHLLSSVLDGMLRQRDCPPPA